MYLLYMEKHGKNFEEHNKKTDNQSIKIYINKRENRVKFKIKTRYYLDLLTAETTKLLGSTENKITKDKNDENLPLLQIKEVASIRCNNVNNDYQQDSTVLYTFVPKKLFANLLEIAPTNFIPLKTFNPEFQTIEVWFTDQNSQPL